MGSCKGDTLEPVSVLQLNNYIAGCFERDENLRDVVVQGEVSNYKGPNRAGHLYFRFKDDSIAGDESVIECKMWRGTAAKYGSVIDSGRRIVIRGYVNVYVPYGQYSLICNYAEKKGIGNLAVEFEKMRARLEAEGLFDQNHKKPLPKYPQKIAIVTAAGSAALKDFTSMIAKRNDYVSMFVFPCSVQGNGAAEDIARALDLVNEKHPEMDVILMGRGGGSAEDLWAYNEEPVARAIYRSQIPIISSVGHEVDVTIADYVADARAATPTDAANLAVPSTEDIRADLRRFCGNLEQGLEIALSRAEKRLEAVSLPLQKQMLLTRIDGMAGRIEGAKNRLQDLNPLSVLDRGYTLIRDARGKIVASVEDTSPRSKVKIRFKDGVANATIDSKERSHERNDI